MRLRGLRPNRVTYSALINACGRAGQLARAFQTLDDMVSSGIEPNVVTWTTLIDACGKGKVRAVLGTTWPWLVEFGRGCRGGGHLKRVLLIYGVLVSWTEFQNFLPHKENCASIKPAHV